MRFLLTFILLAAFASNAYAVVAYDAFSTASEGTGNLSWTHTPTGTPKGVIVFVAHGVSGADEVTSVTYGGQSVTEVAGSPLIISTVGHESEVVYGYFLGSSIPTGAQTVVVTVSGGNLKAAWAVTVTAAADTAVQDTDTIDTTSQNPRGTLALSGQSCFCTEVWGSDLGSTGSVSPITDWTSRAESNLSATGSTFGVYTYDTIGTADVTTGFDAMSSNQLIVLAVAVTEAAAVTSEYYVDPDIAADSGTGTVGDPFGDLQFAFDTVTRNASEGDRFNIKAGTAEVLTGPLDLSTYGAPTEAAPVTIQGYTSVAGDDGIGEIDGDATYAIFDFVPNWVHFEDLTLGNTGANNVIAIGESSFVDCTIENSTENGIVLIGNGAALNGLTFSGITGGDVVSEIEIPAGRVINPLGGEFPF